jgi:hypothetical protein
MRTRVTISVIVVALGLIFSVGGSYALALWVQRSSNQQWCAALQLLTSQPVNPPADPSSNPSRVAQYKLYTDFLTIEKRFGC